MNGKLLFGFPNMILVYKLGGVLERELNYIKTLKDNIYHHFHVFLTAL